MDPTWIPYRKTTLKGVAFVNGEATLDELYAQVLDSLERLKIYTETPECLPLLQEWKRRVESCRDGELSGEFLKAWIKRQSVWFPETESNAGS